MKYLPLFLSMIAVVYGAAIDTPAQSIISAEPLFITANKYQVLFTELQTDINVKLAEIRTAVSTVLKASSAVTLAAIESNAETILSNDNVVRTVIFNQTLSECNKNLRNQINSVTEFSGFGSSICVAQYDNRVQDELKVAYEILRQYEGQLGDVQQTVIRSFILANVYTFPEVIEGRFESQYALRSDAWAKIRPEVEKFVNNLSAAIDGYNTLLNVCFKGVQDGLTPQYTRLSADVSVCTEFDSTPPPY